MFYDLLFLSLLVYDDGVDLRAARPEFALSCQHAKGSDNLLVHLCRRFAGRVIGRLYAQSIPALADAVFKYGAVSTCY